MANYIDPLNFLPIGAIEILRSKGFWDKETDIEWIELIDTLEVGAIASITATVNFNYIEDENIKSELIKNHVSYSLFMPLTHNERYVEQAQIFISRYDDLIDRVKLSQDESDIKSEETFIQIPAIIIGKGG